MLEPGQTIDRYLILRVLGQGGMAVVYAAQHVELGSMHAIKVLMITTQHLRDRALQEGRIQAGLNHPNIVAVSDVVRIDGAPALVMELVRGPSLEGFLHVKRPNIEQIDTLARGILMGLELAHHKGRVHRDLKPANVLLAVENGSVVPKLADFGLAKILSGDALSMSRTGTTMGTPAYMAPEQFRDAKGVDERADIFSLGVLLYELCTGAMPYPGSDMISLFQAIEAGEFVLPTTHVPELPKRMEQAICKALYADPAFRHETVTDFLESWCDGRPAPVLPFSPKEAAELLLLGPELPAAMPLNSPSLRGPTHGGTKGPRPSDSQAAGAWEHISGDPEPPPQHADGATLMPGSFAEEPSPIQGPDTVGLAPTPVVPNTPPGSPPSAIGFSDFPAEPEEEKERSNLPVIIGIVAVVLLGIGGLWAWNSSRPELTEGPVARQEPEVLIEEPAADPVADPVVEPEAPVVASLEPDPKGEAEPTPVREPKVVPERVVIPPEPEIVPEPAKPDPVVEAPVAAPSGTGIRLRGVDRGYVVDGQGKQHGMGALSPGKYKVYAFFDASKATKVLDVDLKQGQSVQVSCDPGMRMCRAK